MNCIRTKIFTMSPKREPRKPFLNSLNDAPMMLCTVKV